MTTITELTNAVNSSIDRIPEQGPLEYFIHHNTLHHYQHMEFGEAVKRAAFDFQCNAFMSEEYYLEEYSNRRIHKSDLNYEIDHFLKKHQLNIPRHIFYNLLIPKFPPYEYLSSDENQAIRQHFTVQKKVFYKSAIQEEYGIDLDHFISPVVYKFFAAYFDFGSAYSTLPYREQGIWTTFCNIHVKSNFFDSGFLKRLSREINEYWSMSPSNVLLTLIKTLNISTEDLDCYFFELAFRYKGWAGLIKSLEKHPEWIKVQQIKPSSTEFLTIILLCEAAAIKYVTPQLPQIPRQETYYQHSEGFIHHFFYELCKNHVDKEKFLRALPFLNDKSRQQILHQAFERSFYTDFLNTYATQNLINTPAKSQYQVICCLDEREESLRRYLERDPACETFGHAGHWGLNISFKGYFDKHQRSLCPILARPEYLITETGRITHPLGLKYLFLWGELLWLSALSSKTIFKGTIQSFIGCFFKIIPFTLDIISPRITSQLKHAFTKRVNETVQTHLVYKDVCDGIDLSSRIQLAQNLLSTLGLTGHFGEFIIILGHGSSSLNNPHEAAYDCGACGGGRGGPNSRLMALILNEPEVRAGLKSKKIVIPDTTYFIGAYHNTCSDDISYYDVPPELQIKFSAVQYQLKKALELNAKERCRRFASISLDKPTPYYHRKVQERALDLRQPRPEYGHSTNALCIIGPRSHSKHLFLDRRAFLVSYDPYTDQQGIILEKLLNTAGPVCAGINLEYFFSYIDNETYGCGTKLAHNVTSLLGVMNGYLSDLQNGLTSQMIEIHHPIRLCMLVICSLPLLKLVLQKNTEFSELVRNQWIKLTVHNIEDKQIYLYEEGNFELFIASNHPPSYFSLDDEIFRHPENLSFGRLVL